MLKEIIKCFFKESYRHNLEDNLCEALSKLLQGKVDETEIAFFLEENYTPLKLPDEKFSVPRIFSLLSTLQPLMVENKMNNYIQVFLKGIISPLLCNINSSNSNLLSDYLKKNSPLRLYKTKYFTLSLLGKSEFNIARSFNDVDNDLSERYFRKALNSLIAARDLGFNPDDRFNYGMVGVCHYYIAVSTDSLEDKNKEFKQAIENLEKAEILGDTSRDHFQYLGHALFEYSCFENRLEDYEKALAKLKIAFEKGNEDSNSIVSLARCNLNIGINYSLQRDSKGINYLKEAIGLLNLLLSKKELINKKYPEEAITGRKAQALFFIWNSANEDISNLDECISILKNIVSKDSKSYWDHTLINALIEKYQVANDVDCILYARELSDKKSEHENQDIEYWKQRGRVYLCLGNFFEDKNSFDAFEVAIHCFTKCLGSNETESQGYLGIAYGLRGLTFRNEDDLRNGIKFIELSKYHEEGEKSKIGILPRLYRQLGEQNAGINNPEAIKLFQKSIDLLFLKFSDTNNSLDKLQAEIASMIGGAYLYKYKLSDETNDIQSAHLFLTKSAHLGMNDKTFYGVFGQVCLDMSKISMDVYEQTDYLQDASDYFKKSNSLGNDESSNFSKWGEALLRLNRVNKKKWTLKDALIKFIESQKRGNYSEENLGLIGDCYYQLSRLEDPIENLLNALKYKQQAKDKGHTSKENSSVSARINLILYQKTKDRKYFLEGIRLIFESININRHWPWPICQLAEVCRDFSREIETEKNNFNWDSDAAIFEMFSNSKSLDLWIQGARLTINQKAVKQEILGGKSKVFVKKDPYGLISSTFVFKPGDNPNPQFARYQDNGFENLTKEKERTNSFKSYVEKFNKPDYLVPTPLEIFHIDKAVMYSMLRVNGRELGEILIYEDDIAYKDEIIQKSIDYLALFHSWNPAPFEYNISYHSLTNPIKNILNDLGKRTQSTFNLGDLLISKCSKFKDIIQDLPIMEKKDAHPENWLITDDNKIILIDIEEPTPPYKYLLDDLIQLIDDYPYLLYSTSGWVKRKRHTQKYISSLNEYRQQNGQTKLVIDSEKLNLAYLSLLYLRGLFLIGLTSRKTKNINHTESSLSRWSSRKSHAFNLLKFVEDIWSQEFSHIDSPDWKSINSELISIRKTTIIEVS